MLLQRNGCVCILEENISKQKQKNDIGITNEKKRQRLMTFDQTGKAAIFREGRKRKVKQRRRKEGRHMMSATSLQREVAEKKMREGNGRSRRRRI